MRFKKQACLYMSNILATRLFGKNDYKPFSCKYNFQYNFFLTNPIQTTMFNNYFTITMIIAGQYSWLARQSCWWYGKKEYFIIFYQGYYFRCMHAYCNFSFYNNIPQVSWYLYNVYQNFGTIAEYPSTFKEPLEILVATWLHSEL
jgi:hypothetical protein